jgi:hypothetical protein
MEVCLRFVVEVLAFCQSLFDGRFLIGAFRWEGECTCPSPQSSANEIAPDETQFHASMENEDSFGRGRFGPDGKFGPRGALPKQIFYRPPSVAAS